MVHVIEELKVTDEMDIYDIFSDMWNCMEPKELQEYCEYFKLPEHMIKHLLRRF